MGAALVFLVLVPLAIFLIGWTYKTRSSLIDRQREEITDTITNRTLHSKKSSLAFDPASATLVHEIEAIRGETPSVQSTRLYRNPEGEYFFFMCTAGSPGFIKHLSRNQAKRLLKPYKAAYAAEFESQAKVGQDEL